MKLLCNTFMNVLQTCVTETKFCSSGVGAIVGRVGTQGETLGTIG
jgi:hypothetical protein